MSAIPFDPASSSGNPSGTRSQSRAASHAADKLSFDVLLARSHSRYESELTQRSRETDSRDEYDYGTARPDDIDAERERDVSSERFDEDADSWDEPKYEDRSTDHSDSGYGEASYDDSDPDYEGSATAAPAAEQSDNPGTGPEGTDATAAASGVRSQSEVSGQASNRTASSAASTTSPAGASAQPAPAQTGPVGQQAQGQTATTAGQASNASASVSNKALLSQANTALTDGSAVVALQSVDAKAAGNGAKGAGLESQLAATLAEGADGTVAEGQRNPATQPAQSRQLREAAQTAAVQAAAGNASDAQNAAQNPAQNPAQPGLFAAGQTPSGPAAGAEGFAVSSSAQPAGHTSTPAFSSLAPVGGVAQTAQATAAGAAASGNAASSAAAPSEQVAVEIHKGIAAGKDAITIRLNPAELGKIDVKMELSDDGSLRAVIAVDKPETLELLQKDVKGLERALQNAGLQADSGSLNFSLRGEGGNHANGQETASGNRGSAGGRGEDTISDDAAGQDNQHRQASHDGAIDISV